MADVRFDSVTMAIMNGLRVGKISRDHAIDMLASLHEAAEAGATIEDWYAHAYEVGWMVQRFVYRRETPQMPAVQVSLF